MLAIVFFFGKAFAQTGEKPVSMEFLKGTWSPVTYDRIDPELLCLEIGEADWMTFLCTDSVGTNTKCPFQISGNKVRVICDELEQTQYTVKKLTENELVVDISYLKPNGKLKRIRRNVHYRRRKEFR